jgi:hypothetical protein
MTPRVVKDGINPAFPVLPICVQSPRYDLSAPIKAWNKALDRLALYQAQTCVLPYALVIKASADDPIVCAEDDCNAITTLVYDKLGVVSAALVEIDPDVRPADLLRTITHELGHVLGLGHSSTEVSVMWPTAAGLSPWFIIDEDVRGVEAIYE